MTCNSCKARTHCPAAVKPGSIVCMSNSIRYGGTHADDTPVRQPGDFCQYCGQKLRVIGSERFCNNPQCVNRYVQV